MNLINKSDRIFIAGSTGMVGSSLNKKFKEKGYENLLTPGRAQLDLTNKNKVDSWFKLNKPDITVISAAKVGGILANNNFPVDFLLENLKIQINLIESSWKYGVKRLMFLGSSCIYPKNCQQPIIEDYLLQGELEKTNEWYAIAKISGIKLCDALRKQYGFDAISVMPTNLYGPRDNYHLNNSHVMAAMIRRFITAKKNEVDEVVCWGSGQPFREFLHVDDLSDACLFLLENWDLKKENAPKLKFGEVSTILNVGSGKDISIKELAELVSEIVGFKGKIKWDASKPDGTKRKLLDVSKINSMGWKSKISLEEGIKMTVQNYIKEEINY